MDKGSTTIEEGAPRRGSLVAEERWCKSDQESWSCKNMRPVENDTSMTHEHYACGVCGRRMALDYDEMR